MSETASYRVPGMMCEHCRAAVTEEVSGVGGVDRVVVDLERKLVQVSGRGLNDASVRAAIAEAGYEVE